AGDHREGRGQSSASEDERHRDGRQRTSVRESVQHGGGSLSCPERDPRKDSHSLGDYWRRQAGGFPSLEVGEPVQGRGVSGLAEVEKARKICRVQSRPTDAPVHVRSETSSCFSGKQSEQNHNGPGKASRKGRYSCGDKASIGVIANLIPHFQLADTVCFSFFHS